MKKSILTLALFTTVSTTFAATQDTTPSVFTAGINESATATQSRWVKEFSGDKEATSIAKKQFVEKFVAQYQALFQQYKKVNQAQFVAFEEQQLNDTIQAHRDASVKQAHVRFGVLNKNKDDKISLKEFQDVGVRSFENFDKNQDGIVNAEDAKLETKKSTMHGGAMFKMAVSIPVATDVNSFIEQHGQGKDYVTLAQFLTEREKQFVDTDTNHDWGLSEDEYVTEFTQRYDENASQAKARLNVFYNDRFTAIAHGKLEISQKDVKHFAESLFKYWDKNKNGKIELGE
ncbi:hypothetical protein [Acinetobacter rathckeae]|uniref:hypothetical protein n=1 Tax=Acinetobacter rathckeae TaxID=2605272 RepID=UPI0018A26CBF|nr:hypothetical protein [Acinetobacter rathckeae]MBF7688544.1 hypothetical protein [Acinetobacter rathckeae]MBF7695791.1 hypothetical protein [Acinetobacter rathckeae]